MSSILDTYVDGSSFSRLKYFALFLLCGLLIFVIPRFLFGVFEPVFQLCLTVIFYSLTRFTRKNNGYDKYNQIYSAFLIASIITFLDNLVYFFEINKDTTIPGMFFTQIITSTLIIAPILMFTRTSGTNYSSIYLQRGNLRKNLAIGLGSFLFFLVLTIVNPRGASMFFPINPDVSNAKLVSLLMWIVPFVLLNGVKEELWFRGLFLKQYELFLGPYLANILQPLIFSVAHMSVEYTSVLLGFLVVTFVLGLVWGYIIQRTDSIIGASLFHSATDIAIILGIFSYLV